MIEQLLVNALCGASTDNRRRKETQDLQVFEAGNFFGGASRERLEIIENPQ
jgi:hypothetical protein